MKKLLLTIAVLNALSAPSIADNLAAQPAKPTSQRKVKKTELKYPANNNLLPGSFITREKAISNLPPGSRVLEAKMLLFGKASAETGIYNSNISKNRMVWIVRGITTSEISMSRGRAICTANAKIVTLIDAKTGYAFGRGIYCPPENEIDFYPG